MIRAVVGEKASGRRVVFLGLQDENLRRLTEQDQPISVDLRRVDPIHHDDTMPDVEVVIFHATPANEALLRERLHL